MFKNMIILSSVFTLFICLNIGCGGGGSGDAGSENVVEVTGIGPEGGLVEDAYGAKVVIPENALLDTYDISVSSYIDNDSLPNDWAPIPNIIGAIKLEPEGLTFNNPVTVTIPVSNKIDPGNRFPLLYWNSSTQKWDQTTFIATVADDGMSFSADITHFSGYGGGAIQNLISGGSASAFMSDFMSWFQNNVKKIGDITERKNDCFRLTGMDFDLQYDINGETGSLIERIGETSDYVDPPLKMVDYIYDVTNGHGFSGYVRITVIIYYDCTEPDFQISADQSVLLEGESTSVEASISCAGLALIGKDITFDIKSGPGEVNPGNMAKNSGGKATTTFTAGESNAVVRAIYYSCEFGDSTLMETTAPIAVGPDSFILTISFDQTTSADSYQDYWSYQGAVSIRVTNDNGDGTADIEGSSSFDITGEGSAGDCTSETKGKVTYNYTGTLLTDTTGDQTLQLTQKVSFDSTKTTYCPDNPPFMNSYPAGSETSSFEIPVENGYTIDQEIPSSAITTHIIYVLSVSG